MRNRSIRWLALQFLKGQGKRFIGAKHYLTLAGICLGVIALLCVSSVMNGFRKDMQGRIIGTFAELRVSSANSAKISDYEHILKTVNDLGYRAAPVKRSELLIRNGDAVEPLMCFGVDIALQTTVSTVLKGYDENLQVKQGIIAGTTDPLFFEKGGIILGSGLASRLNLDVGDRVQLISPMFNQPTAFGLLPRMKTVVVQAIYSGGMAGYDYLYSYIPMSVADYFDGNPGTVDYIELKSNNGKDSKEHIRILSKSLPGFEVLDWSSFDPSLYSAIRFEKVMMLVIMLFMYIIASFNLTGNMLKTIAQKKKELGLLKAIGYRESDLRRLFLLKSLILSSVGIGLGVIISLILLLLQKNYELLKFNLQGSDYIALPVSMEVTDFLVVISLAYILSFLSTLFPLRQLRSINTIELIRQNA